VSDPEQPPFPQKAFTKILFIFLTLGSVFALCVAACWVLGQFANDTLCELNFEGC